MTGKITIWKVKESLQPDGLVRDKNMWMARCPQHGLVAQYWAFGATLGSVLEHLRRQHRKD